jgi:hypothetical protein
MIHTSYFKKSYDVKGAINIALSHPDFFTGPSYPDLFPTWRLINQYKGGIITEQKYIEWYLKLLDQRNLDPLTVANQLDGCTLLCWEESGKFCHRHVVADWLRPCVDVEEIKQITLF